MMSAIRNHLKQSTNRWKNLKIKLAQILVKPKKIYKNRNKNKNTYKYKILIKYLYSCGNCW